MVTSTSTAKVAKAISYAYQSTDSILTGTDADTAVTTYLATQYPSKTTLLTLRDSLITYKNALPSSSVSYSKAVDVLLKVINSEALHEQVGYTVLSSNFATEQVNGLTFSDIRDELQLNIAGHTTMAGLSRAIAETVSGIEATATDTLKTALITGMTSGDADDDVSVAVTAIDGALAGIGAPNAANIAAVIFDGTRIVDAGGDETTLSTAITSYSTSDSFVTTTSAIGTGDISSISSSDDDTITGAMGNTDVSNIGASLSAALGTPGGNGMLGAASTTVAAAVGSGFVGNYAKDSTISLTTDQVVDLLETSLGVAANYATDAALARTITNAVSAISPTLAVGTLETAITDSINHDNSCTSHPDLSTSAAKIVTNLGALSAAPTATQVMNAIYDTNLAYAGDANEGPICDASGGTNPAALTVDIGAAKAVTISSALGYADTSGVNIATNTATAATQDVASMLAALDDRIDVLTAWMNSNMPGVLSDGGTGFSWVDTY